MAARKQGRARVGLATRELWRQGVLDALGEGFTVLQACAIAGVGRSTFYAACNESPEYQAAVELAKQRGYLELVRSVRNAATQGSTEVRIREVPTRAGVVELKETILRPPDARLALHVLARMSEEWRMPREQSEGEGEETPEEFDLTMRLRES